MFLHFVPVDGVEYFSGFLGRERYVYMFSENEPVDTALRHCHDVDESAAGPDVDGTKCIIVDGFSTQW
jgi:hypothetical protein